MIDQKKMFEDSSNFFIKETDRVIELISKTKSEKKRISYINMEHVMYLIIHGVIIWK